MGPDACMRERGCGPAHNRGGPIWQAGTLSDFISRRKSADQTTTCLECRDQRNSEVTDIIGIVYMPP